MACAGLLLAVPATLFAQSNPHDVPRDETAYVDQTPARSSDAPQIQPPSAPDRTSSVYLTDQITPQSIANARARAAEQEQIQRQREQAALSQLSDSQASGQDVAQLSKVDSSSALAQLTEAERQVVLEAVQGTDICEQANNIPAIQQLCDSRIETRSAEFADTSSSSAEDNLLGGGLDADRLATLESAISRLAQSGADTGDFSNQVIASVALDRQTASNSQAAEGDPTSDLSPETQSVVNAIVQQLSGN